MNPTTDSALAQLRDIRDIDPIAWWPPAPGWWVLLGIALLGMAVAIALAWWLGWLRRDWRRDARRRLWMLRIRVHQLGAKEVAAQLSELLRRIGMARYGRVTCASLTGEAWLHWLEAHDPAQFAWIERGRVLIDLPYAPPREQTRITGADPDNLCVLVQAALPWLEKQHIPIGSIWHRF